MSIDFTDAHSKLIEKNTSYRKAVEASFIDRQEDLNEAFNKLIDELLVDTDRNFELHVMLLDFAGENPYGEKRPFFEEEDDFAVAVICDNGMLILGRIADVTFNWDDVAYMLQYKDDSVLIHLNEGTDYFFGDDNFATIFNSLRETITGDNAIPRFIES